MTFKEKAIISLNEAIYAKGKLTKKQREELIILREDIRKSKTKKGIMFNIHKLLKIIGIDLDTDDGDE